MNHEPSELHPAVRSSVTRSVTIDDRSSKPESRKVFASLECSKTIRAQWRQGDASNRFRCHFVISR